MRLDKTNRLKDGNQLFAYWANNKGRGSNNCTLQVVGPNTNRPNFSRDTKDVISETQCSSWAGNVNLSKRVCEELGIRQEDIVSITSSILSGELRSLASSIMDQ